MFVSLKSILIAFHKASPKDLSEDSRNVWNAIQLQRSRRTMHFFKFSKAIDDRIITLTKELNGGRLPKDFDRLKQTIVDLDNILAARRRALAQILITFMMIFIFFVLLITSEGNLDREKAAYGTLGTIIGFWLR